MSSFLLHRIARGDACTDAPARHNTCMNKPLKIGNSAGIVLPKDMLARLRVGPGHALYLTEATDGVRLTATDPDFEEQMKVAEDIMRRDRNVLRALAK